MKAQQVIARFILNATTAFALTSLIVIGTFGARFIANALLNIVDDVLTVTSIAGMFIGLIYGLIITFLEYRQAQRAQTEMRQIVDRILQGQQDASNSND